MMLPRLYPILDTETLAQRGLAADAAAEAMIAGGARILQFRHKGHYTAEVFATAERVAVLCRDARVTFIVDDRADIARLLGAGLHVGQQDLEPSDARRVLGDGAVLGYSTHNAGQLAAGAAEPVDYLAIGPIFPTGSKQNPDPVVGLAQLPQLRRLTARPLVAIGGITRQNARAVIDGGADAVAVIGDLLPAECTTQSVRERMEEWQAQLNP